MHTVNYLTSEENYKLVDYTLDFVTDCI